MDPSKPESEQVEAGTSTPSMGRDDELVQMEGHDYHDIIPKPSKDPNDPLNWTWLEKHAVLLVVALMAFQGPFDAGSPTTAFYPQAEQYGVPVDRMLDSIGPFGVALGIGSLLWLPLSNRYGRTPVYFAAAVVATLGALGCSLANTLPAFIGARVVNAFGCSAAISIGSSTVRDMFFVHERGAKMGIWTLCIGMSPYLSPVLCGVVAQYSNWRWMQWLTFFWWCSLLIPCAFLPETLYHRNYDAEIIPPKDRFLQRIRWKRFDGNLTYKTFLRPFVMLKYPSVFIPVFYYGNMYGFCVFGGLSALPYVFTEDYGFSTLGVGLAALGFLIGTVLGEPMAGPFSDWVTRYVARRQGGIRHPEQRLHALWLGAIMVPIGLMMLGLTLQYKVHWIAPLISIGIYSFALQILSTVVTTYTVDCYEHMAGEVGTLVNLGRQLLSFYVAFYIIHYLDRVGYAWAYGIFAMLSVVMAVPVMLLLIWGGSLRAKMGIPYAPTTMQQSSRVFMTHQPASDAGEK